MIDSLLNDFEEARNRIGKRLTELEGEKTSLLGRLEGFDLAIAMARTRHEEELEAARLEKARAEAPIVFDAGDHFDDFGLEGDELGQLIELRPSQGLSDGSRAQTGSQSAESPSEPTGAFIRQDGPLSPDRPGPRSRRRKRRAR